MSYRARALAAMLALAACAPPPPPPAPRPAAPPLTRAERTNYQETSRYADVRAFLDSLRAFPGRFVFGVLGQTAGGRDIPYVIASRPLVFTPQEAQRLGRPVVYVQGNIHAGEVEGKEALQMLLRDLALDPRPNVLDSIVLIAVPIYNADGNEAVGQQETNRPDQNGPAIVGGRARADELNLNRDYMKAEAPETRGSLAMFNSWDPDVFVDLHTTNGSLHGYALTYAPPLNPAAPLATYTRDVWLPILRQRMRARHGFETFDYGNFGSDETPWQDRLVYSPQAHAWSTFDSRPRFSTNYYGLRGGVAILSEGYSHDPFARRVASTYAFVREILSLAAEHGSELRQRRANEVSERHVFLPIRSRFTTTPPRLPVLVEEVEATGGSARAEPGLRAGLRRTGRTRAVTMPIYDRFEPVHEIALPRAYIVPERLTRVIEVLRAHGIQMVRWDGPAGDSLAVSRFVVDSVRRAAQPFEGHRETRAFGTWATDTIVLSASDFIVPTTQPLGLLAVYLLEPESDDGFVNWNFLDSELVVGGAYPIARLVVPRD